MSGALRRIAQDAPVPLPVEHVLTGHSGARVVLHSNGADSFVRKTAASRAASARLGAQADKQHAFWMSGQPFPRVRAQRVDAQGIASFDMNYIPGRTIADAVIKGETFDPVAIVKAVDRLTWLFAAGAGEALPDALFRGKIGEIARAAGALEGPVLPASVRDCGRRLEALDWSGIPQSPCHGDLTLENILLTAGKSVAFIDCDEGFASSFWLDFGKLFQDICGHWCIRALYDAGAARLLNAIQKLEQLGMQFRTLAARLDPELVPRLPQLAALGLYRAIPYSRDTAEIAFVCRRIEILLEA